jgi:hypothetical protein
MKDSAMLFLLVARRSATALTAFAISPERLIVMRPGTVLCSSPGKAFGFFACRRFFINRPHASKIYRTRLFVNLPVFRRGIRHA